MKAKETRTWRATGPLLAAALLLFVRSEATAGEAYFMAIFAVQTQPTNKAALAHSFAVFVKASGAAERIEDWDIDSFCISWLPKTLTVRLYRLLPETGYNLTLKESLDWAHQRGLHVSMWGPYQIEPCLYHAACQRKAELESGHVRYKAIDTAYPSSHVTNCIHAITDLAFRVKRVRIGSPSWGDAASYFITESLRPKIIDPDASHDWLLEPLGLGNEPIVRRHLGEGNPTTRPVLRMLQNVAHSHLLRHARK